MGRSVYSTPVIEIASQGVVSDADVARLRREVFSRLPIDADDAAALFFINERCVAQGTAWCGFFVDTLADYVVHRMAPQGRMDADKADWLIARIDHNGQVASAAEFALLLKVLEEAASKPAYLEAYARAQKRHGAPLDADGGAARTPGGFAALRQAVGA